MIIMTRRKNESLVINGEITVMIVDVRGDSVRLGIEAPKEVPVHRGEVYQAIQGVAKSPRATEDEALESVAIRPAQGQWLDRLARQIREGGEPVTRAHVAQTVLDAVADLGSQLADVHSLEDLRRLLAESLRRKADAHVS